MPGWKPIARVRKEANMRNQAKRIKECVSPQEFYREQLPCLPPPKRDAGWVSGGLCPFHDDRRTGNFRVNLNTGAFKCFACGARGGDVIDFLQRRDKLTFCEALKALKNMWGVAP